MEFFDVILKILLSPLIAEVNVKADLPLMIFVFIEFNGYIAYIDIDLYITTGYQKMIFPDFNFNR